MAATNPSLVSAFHSLLPFAHAALAKRSTSMAIASSDVVALSVDIVVKFFFLGKEECVNDGMILEGSIVQLPISRIGMTHYVHIVIHSSHESMDDAGRWLL